MPPLRPRSKQRRSVRDAVHVGTSGWTYDDWEGAFYPEDVKGTQRLEYYADRFDTVEVNATFYRFPSAKTIDSWNRRLPRSFHMVLKGTRRVTHFRKLRDCDEVLAAFLERVEPLETLKVILWQLPPSLERDDATLREFLGLLPRSCRHAIEFRHASWWDDDVAAILERENAAFVAVSHPELPDTVFPTSDFLYLRFHGLGQRLYDYDYSCQQLRGWVENVAPHRRGRSLYAFFNNDWHANAPRNALMFRELLEHPD